MKQSLSKILIIFISSLLAACAATKDSAESYPGESPQQIYTAGKQALQDKSYSEAVKRFEALDVQYPYGKETENAEFYLVYAYYMKEDYALAMSAADRFIRLYPIHPHIDYIYYIRGLSDYYRNMGLLERIFAVDLATRDLTQIQKSYNDFNELVTRFPNSYYTPAAYQYMIYLRDVLASHELQVGEYYYSRRAYLAAANRASNVVAHYEGAPAVVPALKLMVNSYQKLGLNKLAQDAQLVLQYNYPTVQGSH